MSRETDLYRQRFIEGGISLFFSETGNEYQLVRDIVEKQQEQAWQSFLSHSLESWKNVNIPDWREYQIT